MPNWAVPRREAKEEAVIMGQIPAAPTAIVAPAPTEQARLIRLRRRYGRLRAIVDSLERMIHNNAK